MHFIPLFCLMSLFAQGSREMPSGCAAFLYGRLVDVQNHRRKNLGNLYVMVACFSPFNLYSFCKVRNFEEENLNKYGIFLLGRICNINITFSPLTRFLKVMDISVKVILFQNSKIRLQV